MTLQPQRNSHCSFCGHPFASQQPWPRVCVNCQSVSYLNPLPVAVMIVPVGEGVMVVRRGVEPRKGAIALPGGFIDHGESWQAACAREVFEETGVRIDVASVTLLAVHSAPDGTVLIFGTCPPRSLEALPSFEPNAEVPERFIIDEALTLAFPLHTRVLADWFAGR